MRSCAAPGCCCEWYAYYWRVATDVSGNKATAALSVMVDNQADSIPPVVQITSPLNGSTLSRKGTVKFSATASDSGGVVSMRLYLDGALVKSCSAVTSCSVSVSASKLIAGQHTFRAEALDRAGNLGVVQSIATK